MEGDGFGEVEVSFFKDFVCLNEKGAAAAGGIDDLYAAQGINSSEGSWIGQSVGSFSGSLLSLSGAFDGVNWELYGNGGSGGFTFAGSHSDGLAERDVPRVDGYYGLRFVLLHTGTRGAVTERGGCRDYHYGAKVRA